MKVQLLNILNKYGEVIRYLVVGILTTVFSFLIYYLCSRVVKLDYKISIILSWFMAVIFAFFSNKIIVFKSNTNYIKDFFAEIINFFKYRILSLLIDFFLMLILVELINIYDVIAKIVVQIVIVIINYIFSKFFVFNTKA